MLTLWTEQYRPTRLQEFVWVDLEMRATVEEWLTHGALPHCLFSGVQGTGKTSLAKLLFRHLDIPATDILYVNASRERQIDAFQDKIVNFVNSWALGPSGIKYILLDEADKMSQMAQGLLRNEMETNADICRFVMTANYPQKIIPAIHSRVQELRFPSLDREDFMVRLVEILDNEKVTYTGEVLVSYVAATYPDLRKCINLAQQNSRTPPKSKSVYTTGTAVGGCIVEGVSGSAELGAIRKDESITKDYLLTMYALFRAGKFTEARKCIVEQIQPEQYDDFYRALYQNLPLFGVTQSQQDDALLVIRKAMLNHAIIADPEINVAACIMELSRIAKPNI
jgi:DNA polymerase III delta prime subunit